MDDKYISTAEYVGETIDCRCLILSFEFYKLSGKQIVELATEVLLWLNELLKDGFVNKKIDSRRKSTTVEKALTELKTMVQQERGWSYIQEAYVISSVVYNLKTMNHHLKKLQMEEPPLKDVLMGLSVDYPQYWKELFPNGREDGEVIKQRVLNLFREENRKEVSSYHIPDVQALISLCPYKNNHQLFYGKFSIDFSRFTLNNQLETMAHIYCCFARQISQRYVNVNARVQLQPVEAGCASAYMRYFGGDAKTDNSHVDANCTEKEWYSTYYLPGVEWMNIISPLARMHLPNLSGGKSISEDIILEELPAGSLLVGSKKPIDQYTVSDALELKRLVYPALYPGSSHKSLRDLFQERDLFKQHPTNFWYLNYPRSNWAIVPVLEEEIKIVSTYLVFSNVKEVSEGDRK